MEDITYLKKDLLQVITAVNRTLMGDLAGAVVANRLRILLKEQELVTVVFGAAPSQIDFMQALVAAQGIDWSRVVAFHMDEYIGIPNNRTESFGYFLREHIFGKLPFAAVHYINGVAEDMDEECDRYGKLLLAKQIDVMCMGIGENGHIAFNDPHVADFNDPKAVKIVDMDLACRQQQVNDGCFPTLDSVPTHALCLTVPTMVSAKFTYGVVPGKNKAKAVKHTLEGSIGEECPASILRQTANALLFLDSDSASLL